MECSAPDKPAWLGFHRGRLYSSEAQFLGLLMVFEAALEVWHSMCLECAVRSIWTALQGPQPTGFDKLDLDQRYVAYVRPVHTDYSVRIGREKKTPVQ